MLRITSFPEKQMEKKMENYMEIAMIQGFIRLGGLGEFRA